MPGKVRSPVSSAGLPPWSRADLPDPPMPRGLSWIGVCGPGVIVLGVSIGSGEFLLGPATFVKHGLSLLWVTLVAVFFQTVFNTELMRYTLATGEPVVTGFMRTRPGQDVLGMVLRVPLFPADRLAGVGRDRGGRDLLPVRSVASRTLPAESMAIYAIGVATLLACVVVLLLGKRIARTLEMLNWVLVACIIGSFLVLAIMFVAAGDVGRRDRRDSPGYDHRARRVQLPARRRRHPPARRARRLFGRRRRAQSHAVELGARQGIRHGQPRRPHRGRASAAKRSHLADTGFIFEPDAANLARWRGWWRIVRVDQWGIFFIGALLGMMLPALLYVTFIASGTDIMGLVDQRGARADNMSATAAPWLGLAVAALGVWILFKTQLDCRRGHDALDHRHPVDGQRARARWRGGDVRAVYYTVLAVVVVWGIVALNARRAA